MIIVFEFHLFFIVRINLKHIYKIKYYRYHTETYRGNECKQKYLDSNFFFFFLG